ncbi:exosortase/archaeosortase family protein [Catenulispora pinisilvae]|uniref:exosortase/archaeosortase family protein n=1 Tax=Catenulispora pinisilvae TaxID=2705253 RepID=UPI0018927B5D|nr:exosortase/archaeosortase family protein [Catenulispora pinisilvae]
MRPEPWRVFARIGLLLVGTVGGFVLLQQWMRGVETAATVDVFHALGIGGVTRGYQASIIVDAHSRGSFAAILTPACSSLASLLALGGLAVLRPTGARGRLALALAAAVTVVFLGNIARIAASIGVGLLTGPSALVLFHDWVGSLFAFAYTLGGFVLMLWVLLPRDGVALDDLCLAGPVPVDASVGASVGESSPDGVRDES